MVEQVQAFKDREGGLHTSEESAARADAAFALSDFWRNKAVPGGVSSTDFIAWGIEHANALHAAVDPLIQARKGPTMRGHG